MPAKLNLINQKFGKLLVLEETKKRKNKSIVWKCQCDCGNIEEFSTKELRSDGLIQCRQCGNERKPQTNLLKNIVGEKFNHLTILEKTSKRINGKILYKCQCDCEDKNIVYVSRTDLQSNHTKSCGCARIKYQIGDIINNREIIGFDKEKKSIGHLYYKVKCLFCGKEYSTLISTLKNTVSCGCQKSIGEYNIIQVLENNKILYIKEYSFPNSPLRYDFAILNNNKDIIRLIEFDGEQHYKENIKNSGWNTYKKYEYTLQHDLEKNKMAKEYNIPLVRIPYWERDNITLEILMKNKYLLE